ncbi:DUF2103 domain-containing protein [Sulfoacidibacillus thermotolerans]|uniref:Uncharacterized protein n=1 Tax=Sulfoacidibacillus thermotolerans TaxID=1765684 RepID=A0A2U3D6T0_SULT2|nr:DUF2103 domain-containing protein [Sulfoacidibacillus thermotolerans]PWI56990.1 hypothetical protein BM613_10950 [Sulfoacidibacillus thermotolerans]
MADMRHRDGKLKIMHTIIGDFAQTLRKVAQLDEIEAILTGTIAPSKSYQESLTFQYFTDNGIKLLAKTTTAVQEIFLVTAHPELVLDELIKSGFVAQERSDVHHNHPRKKRQHGHKDDMRTLAQDQEKDATTTRPNTRKPLKPSGNLVKEAASDPPTLRQILNQETLSALLKLKSDMQSPPSTPPLNNGQVPKNSTNKSRQTPASSSSKGDADEDFAALFAPQDEEESFAELFQKSKLDPKFFK